MVEFAIRAKMPVEIHCTHGCETIYERYEEVELNEETVKAICIYLIKNYFGKQEEQEKEVALAKQ